jgi:hypothetical protein
MLPTDLCKPPGGGDRNAPLWGDRIISGGFYFSPGDEVLMVAKEDDIGIQSRLCSVASAVPKARCFLSSAGCAVLRFLSATRHPLPLDPPHGFDLNMEVCHFG